MVRAIVAVGLAGLASGAAAQSGLVVSLTFDRTATAVGETFNATITASWDGPVGSYLSSVNFDLIANIDGARVNSVAPVAWNNPALGFDGQGVASGADVLGINAAQFSLIPPFSATNPILITRIGMTVTCNEVGLLTYSVRSTAPAGTGAFSVTGPGFSDPVVFFGEGSFSSMSMLVCPTPGVLGVVGLGGVVAVRRRRG